MKRLALSLFVVAASAALSGCGLIAGPSGGGGASGAPVYRGPSSQPGSR